MTAVMSRYGTVSSSLETVTMQSCRESIMSVVSVILAIKRYKAVTLKVRYKILFNSVGKQVESFTPSSLLVISSIYVFYSK